jgi:undecaprenyl-diphosphatase
MRPRILLAVALAAAFAALAVAVAHSPAVQRADQWATTHAMPGLEAGGRAPSAVASAVPFRRVSLHGHAWIRFVTDAWTLPASPLVSALLFALGGLLLVRRGARAAAVAWGAAWVVGNAVEVLTKHVLERPPLHDVVRGARVHVAGFDHSYPSGHALRSVLLAGLVTALWPRARTGALLWALAALPLLLLAGFHAPSDLVGGALLAALLVTLVTRDTAAA